MTQKLFSTQFFGSLISSETSNRFSLSDYFEDAYSREYDFCSYLPYELCHRSVSVTSPFSYEAARLDALCILHTSKGAGRLYCENKNGINAAYDLTKGTLAIIDCRKNHKLLCRHNIWEYTICFVSTPSWNSTIRKFCRWEISYTGWINIRMCAPHGNRF